MRFPLDAVAYSGDTLDASVVSGHRGRWISDYVVVAAPRPTAVKLEDA